jgi:hypothetical protein
MTLFKSFYIVAWVLLHCYMFFMCCYLGFLNCYSCPLASQFIPFAICQVGIFPHLICASWERGAWMHHWVDFSSMIFKLCLQFFVFLVWMLMFIFSFILMKCFLMFQVQKKKKLLNLSYFNIKKYVSCLQYI